MSADIRMDRGQAILVTEKIAAGFAAVAIALEKGAQALERGEPPAAVAHYLRFLAKEVQSVVDVV